MSARRRVATVGGARLASRVVRIAFAGAFALCVAGSAAAFVPKPERALAGVAQANMSSGRTQAIQLDLVMRVGDREAVASGELVSHPSGLARLELRGASGRVDRYLLSGPELQAAKDGEPLADPEPMLQPFFLLQPSSQETLRVALESFGVDSRLVGLAPCGELDCYVFGDPSLAIPERRFLPDARDAEGAATGRPGPTGIDFGAEPRDESSGSRRGGSLEILPSRDPGAPVARVWVDVESLQIQRIDRASGESVSLGPLVRFERLLVPSWLEIEQSGRPAIHFDVKRAVRVNATPQAFHPSWLYAPIDAIDPAGAVGPGGAAPSPVSPTPAAPAAGSPRAPSRP